MPDISDIVRVTAQITSTGESRKEFGRTLFIYRATDPYNPGDLATLAAVRGDRVRDLGVNSYADAAAVAEDFDSVDVAHVAAQAYFSQDPFPRNLMTAAWFESGADTVIRSGAAVTGAGRLSAIQALGAVASIIVAGQTITVDVSGVSSISAIAPLLQSAIRTITNPDLSHVNVSYGTDNIFHIDDEDGNDIGRFVGSLAEQLGLGVTAEYLPGRPAESITDFMDRVAAIDDEWNWVTVESAIANDYADVNAIAGWVEARDAILVVDSTDIGVLSAGETTSIPARLSAQQLARTAVVWSHTADYKAVSLAARMSSQNFSVPNALITAKFKVLPGRVPDVITGTHKRELDRKRLNHYSPYGASGRVVEGWLLKPGIWIDTQYWLAWLKSASRTAVYNALVSTNKIPQTRDGVRVIMDAVEGVLEQGVLNGGCAPGTVTAPLASDIRSATGNQRFDGFLSTGYLIYATPLAQQLQADRVDRKAPPVRVWVKGSGAIHFADISITFEN